MAVQARDRAGEAFDRVLNERGTKPLEPETGALLVAAGTRAIIVGDLLNTIADSGYQVQHPSDGTASLHVQTQLMLAGFLRLADRLDGTNSALLSGAGVSDAILCRSRCPACVTGGTIPRTATLSWPRSSPVSGCSSWASSRRISTARLPPQLRRLTSPGGASRHPVPFLDTHAQFTGTKAEFQNNMQSYSNTEPRST